ncbi:hypothetical protein [Faecalibaculum rodentium]|uniref:hypothetical protein n=1 Tax=Faecalibaculum rodentium TaxID=1702221 RepID=UPI0027309BB4|nr:hypothetical protein [Faecalibaculum rodentium]
MTKLDYIVDLLATNECAAECDKCPFDVDGICVLEARMKLEEKFFTLKIIVINAVLEWADRNSVDIWKENKNESNC